MERPLVAIIGDASKTTKPDVARRAGRELGAELAKRNCRILVFSSSQDFIEWEAVQGYVASAKKLPGSIEVRYPPNLHSLFPDEMPDDPVFVRRQQSGDWEASVYPSFAEIDGLVLVGGADTTKISGLLAMGSKTPIITLAGFGGGARQVWECLKGDRNSPATNEDLDLMASQEWADSSANRLVDCLLSQVQRQQEKATQVALGQTERHRRRVLSMLAGIGSAFFVVVLLALTQLPVLSVLPFWFRCLLLFIPAVAGASGAAIRVLWDNWDQHSVPLDVRPIAMTIALGFWASGVVAALFLLEQIWVAGPSAANDPGKFFGVCIGIGLIAGLTLNRVFPKLIRADVPLQANFTNNPLFPKAVAKRNSRRDSKQSGGPPPNGL